MKYTKRNQWTELSREQKGRTQEMYMNTVSSTEEVSIVTLMPVCSDLKTEILRGICLGRTMNFAPGRETGRSGSWSLNKKKLKGSLSP